MKERRITYDTTGMGIVDRPTKIRKAVTDLLFDYMDKLDDEELADMVEHGTKVPVIRLIGVENKGVILLGSWEEIPAELKDAREFYAARRDSLTYSTSRFDDPLHPRLKKRGQVRKPKTFDVKRKQGRPKRLPKEYQ